MKSHYNVKDVQEIVGISQSKAYDIIRKLRESFLKEYPGTVTVQARIPIWYFEEKMGINLKGGEKNEEEKKN